MIMKKQFHSPAKSELWKTAKLVQIASPVEIFKHPKSEFVAQFTGVKNFFRGELKTIQGSDLKEFYSNGLKYFCLTDVEDGEAFLMIQPDEISISNQVETGSTRNHFVGKITDIAPAKLGMDIYVDIGCEMVCSNFFRCKEIPTARNWKRSMDKF